MYELFQVILLGLIEGVTEFLPISSTGHLIVATNLLGFDDPNGTFEVVIQLGAILAVIWFYRRDWSNRLARFFSDSKARRFWLNLLVAVIPAVIFGLLFERLIMGVLFSPLVVAVSLVVGGVILWLVDKVRSKDHLRTTDAARRTGLDDITTGQALFIGVTQVTALVPGVSRSASSIVGGLFSGLDRETATAFSFYLAIPTLGGATVYKFLRSYHQIVSQGASLNIAVGTVVAFISALFVVRWLLRYISHHNFTGFAIYRIAIGISIIAWISLK